MGGISLDTRLLRISPTDYFTLRDAAQGTLIMGGIGSGKTSGSGAALAGAYLRAGMGGLVLCAKPEEADLWRRYCRQHGSMASLIEFDGERHGFNFLAYELSRQGADGINAVIECLMRVLEIARAVGAAGGRPGEEFWEATTRQILRSALPVIYAATGTVRIADLLAFVRSAPVAPEQMRDPAWQAESSFFALFAQAAERLEPAEGERAIAYWAQDFARLDAKTRGNIVISLTTTLDRFNHGWLARAFCSRTTVVPELTFHGQILLLNMTALTRNEDGILAQQLFKYLWQRAVLSRNALEPRQRTRPVFLWADEAQYFLNGHDADFLSTCRGSRACVVYLSQSLPTFYARMGGDNARERVHHLLGNFATRIWHSNACAESNDWAARTIGRTLQRRGSFNESEGTSENHGMTMGDGTNWGRSQSAGSSFGWSSGPGGSSTNGGVNSSSGSSSGGNDNRGRNRGYGTSESASHGYSEVMDHLIEPAAFGRMLKTGGPAHGGRVSAVWYQAGRTFAASHGNVLLAEFVQ